MKNKKSANRNGMSPDTPKARFARAIVWIILIAAAVTGALYWWDLGRPVSLPDAPSARINCVSYAPFRLPGESPAKPGAFVSPERIDADLRSLSTRFDCVRTYAQGQGLGAVPEIARKYHMQVLMGIWLGRDRVANENEIAVGVANAKKNAVNLSGIVVGNEVLLRGELSETQLAGYIAEVRAQTDVPVTYADVWEYWLHHPKLGPAVSYVTVHILPYWEDEPVPPEDAVAHVAGVYAQVKAAFPGKEVMIGETGWPSAGRQRREAAATRINEARYLREFLRYAVTVHMPYNVIEAFDQPWKRGLEGTVGGYWGIFDVDAKAKFPMQGPVMEEPRWRLGWLAGGIGVLAAGLVGGWRRRWHGLKGWLVLILAGFAAGTAVAAHLLLLIHSCRDIFEWAVGVAAGLMALGTTLILTRAVTARLAGGQAAAVVAVSLRASLPPRWHRGARWPDAFTSQRFFWLFAMTFYAVLLVVDGRYRDFPLGLFAMPGVSLGVLALLRERQHPFMPLVEERIMASWLPVLGAIVIVQEAGLNSTAWLWAGLNLLMAIPVLVAWIRGRQLQPNQA